MVHENHSRISAPIDRIEHRKITRADDSERKLDTQLFEGRGDCVSARNDSVNQGSRSVRG